MNMKKMVENGVAFNPGRCAWARLAWAEIQGPSGLRMQNSIEDDGEDDYDGLRFQVNSCGRSVRQVAQRVGLVARATRLELGMGRRNRERGRRRGRLRFVGLCRDVPPCAGYGWRGSQGKAPSRRIFQYWSKMRLITSAVRRWVLDPGMALEHSLSR